jgi:N-acetylglutamate synthase-like GNAT family acetyltransferase
MKLNIVREARENDFPEVYDMIKIKEDNKVNKDRKQNAADIFYQNVNSENAIYLVSTVKNKIIGFISCAVQRSLSYAGNVAEIQEVSVLCSENAKTIYKKLFVALQNFLKDRKVKHVEIKTNDNEILNELFSELVYNRQVSKMRKKMG